MILKARNVYKTFDKSAGRAFQLQVDDFEIKEGSFTAILGPNGSGKSTFLKLILDLLFTDSGKITLLGTDHKQKQSRTEVSYLPEDFNFPDNFTVDEMLRTFLILKKIIP